MRVAGSTHILINLSPQWVVDPSQYLSWRVVSGSEVPSCLPSWLVEGGDLPTFLDVAAHHCSAGRETP